MNEFGGLGWMVLGWNEPQRHKDHKEKKITEKIKITKR
jgi:hypothetical protein